MKSRYAQDLINEGTIRVGTLYEYKDTTQFSNGIGDKGEGTLSSGLGIPHTFTNDSSTHTPHFSRVYAGGRLKIEEGSSITVGNFNTISPDCYILSLSLTPNQSAADNLNPDYDTRILIRRPEQLVNVLTKYMKKQGLQVANPLIEPVTYQLRSMHHELQSGNDPVFIKEFQYAPQKELRIAWPIRPGDSISAKIITCPQIRQYVELFPMSV